MSVYLSTMFASLVGFSFSFVLTNWHRYRTELARIAAQREVINSRDREYTRALYELKLLTRRVAYILTEVLVPGFALALAEATPPIVSALLWCFAISAWVAWPLSWKVLCLHKLLLSVDVKVANEMNKKDKERLLNALDKLSEAIFKRSWEEAERYLREVTGLVFG